MSISVYPTPSGATTSFYGIVGTTNGSTSVTIPSGAYSFVADNSSGTLTLGDVALSATSGVAYLTSQVTNATVEGLNKGVTWTTVSLSSVGLSSTADQVVSLTFGNGRFIGTSNNGFVFSSPDGISWSRLHSFSSGYPVSIAYGNGTYAALNGGIANNVQTSTDGITWTSRTAGLPALTGFRVVFGNGIFAAAATLTDNFSTSTDGITWTSRAGLGSFSVRGLGFGNGLFLLGRDNGWLSTSTDGFTWTSRTSNMTGTVAGFAYGNNTYIAVGGSGQISSSTDGITWTSRSSGIGNNFSSATFNGGTFIVVGSSGAVVTSTDAITWTIRTSTGPFATTTAINAVTSGNGIFVAGGNVNFVGYANGNKKWFLTKADSTTVI